jgi:hypothetical protein
MHSCDFEDDGDATFDLTEQESAIYMGQDPDQFAVSYHLTATGTMIRRRKSSGSERKSDRPVMASTGGKFVRCVDPVGLRKRTDWEVANGGSAGSPMMRASRTKRFWVKL